MDRKIIDNTGFLRREETFNDDGQVIVKHTQDVESIINQNKRDQNDADFNNGYTPEKDLKHVARVPLVIWQKWWQEENAKRSEPISLYGEEMNQIVRKKLDDPDNAFLRTGLGTIGRN